MGFNTLVSVSCGAAALEERMQRNLERIKALPVGERWHSSGGGSRQWRRTQALISILSGAPTGLCWRGDCFFPSRLSKVCL
jgi:hypothetical protein